MSQWKASPDKKVVYWFSSWRHAFVPMCDKLTAMSIFDRLLSGPDDDSSSDAIEFLVTGKVDVTYEEDSMLVVDTDSLFRGDVTIACDEDRRALEEDESNADEKDGLSRGHLKKPRRLSHGSRKKCNTPELLANDARIDEVQTDKLTIAGTDAGVGDGPTTLDKDGLNLGQGTIDTNGGDIDSDGGTITDGTSTL